MGDEGDLDKTWDLPTEEEEEEEAQELRDCPGLKPRRGVGRAGLGSRKS